MNKSELKSQLQDFKNMSASHPLGPLSPIQKSPNPYDSNSIYYELYEANPAKDLYYQPSFWDRIGLSNKAKDTNLAYQQMYNEYVASIAQMKAENEYNSPVHQAALTRQAGLNPDLAGISDVGKMSGDPYQGSIPASLSGQSPAMDALSSITSVLGFATSTLQQIQTIKGLSEDNILKGLTNFDKFTQLASPHIINEYASRFKNGYSNDWDDVMTVSSSSLGLNRRQEKRYRDAFASLLSSSRFTASEAAYKNLSANDRAMNHYIEKMSELAVLFEKHKFKADISKSVYDKSYFDNLDPKKASFAVNRENDNRGWLDKWRNDYYRTLYNDLKNGSILAGLILIGQSNLVNAGSSAITGLARGLSKL